MGFFLRKRFTIAVSEGGLDRVTKILDDGADINMDLGGGTRPLHIAADSGNVQMIQFLLGRGAKVDQLKDYGWAPIHDAAYAGKFDAVVALLKNGADPNLRTQEGKTAYGWALARKHPEVAELLSPYMKKVVDFAVEHNLKTETPVEKAPEGWMVLSSQQIARAETHAELGYRLTDIFNFRDRERVRIVNNLATKADQVQTASFDDFTDKTAIEAARDELLRRGGTVPDNVLADRLHKLPRPPGS